MRVISGKFKGRPLVDFEAAHIRPTTDRVKETLFNKLMGYIENARVLDLFSGTGNLAIECISRGAAWVDLVESHPESIKIIRANLTKLKVEEGFQIRPIDAFKFISGYEGEKYDIILADPPFPLEAGHRICELIGASGLLLPEGRFVIEVSSKERVDESYAGLERLDQRIFGDKHLHFFAGV